MNLSVNGFAVVFAFVLVSFVPTGASAHGFASRIENELGISGDSFGAADVTPDWSKPAVGCVEDFVPKFLTCLDFRTVANPQTDYPAGLTEAEMKYWTVDHRADLSLCRAREIERREKISPGSMSASLLAWAWMWVKQADHLGEKLKAVYEAAEAAEMPPQILFGALKQESLLSDLGIAIDGGNYSCGIGQVNVGEWCRYMSTLTEAEQRKLGWPIGVSCAPEILPSDLTKPFYDIAIRKLGTRPDYELTPKEFSGIRYADVEAKLPAGDEATQKLRYGAVMSFVTNCSTARLGILAKGKILRGLFVGVPEGLRNAQKYPDGATFSRKCMRKYRSPYYPLHTGWLLADAIYNAGEREVSVLEHYFRMTKATHESGAAWKKLTPTDLIEGLHWGGKWNETTKKIEYTNVYGVAQSQSWFKSCVVQRHIARVIQYATVPGAVIANSLEVGGCSQTTVPDYRKKSSGKKTVKKPAGFALNR